MKRASRRAPTLDLKAYADDPSSFRNDLQVDVHGSVAKFGDVMDAWQREAFAAMDPSLLRCAGRSTDDSVQMRAYLERPRGHSKTTDLAVTAVWLLIFGTRMMKGYSYAADKDQATLLREAIERLLRLNPWMGKHLRVERNTIRNIAKRSRAYNSTLKIETSDVASSYGILPDFLIADEFTHWQTSGEGLWHSLISSAAKNESCFFASIANAGFTETWQWSVREAIRDDKEWFFSRLEGPEASWMTAKRLDEQRRLLPPVAFGRLWLNQWSTGGGDALTEADINAAFAHGHYPMSGDEDGYYFVAGVDLGLTRDCSAVVVLGVRGAMTTGTGRIYLAAHRVWRPQLHGKVELAEVEEYLLTCHQRFNLQGVYFDPWQAAHIAQRLAHRQIEVTELPATGQNIVKMASRLIESFNDRRVILYDCPDLMRDLKALRVEERNYGYRLVSPRDRNGHGDLASAFATAIVAADDLAGEVPIICGAIDFDDPEPYMTGDYRPYRPPARTQAIREQWAAGILPFDPDER